MQGSLATAILVTQDLVLLMKLVDLAIPVPLKCVFALQPESLYLVHTNPPTLKLASLKNMAS